MSSPVGSGEGERTTGAAAVAKTVAVGVGVGAAVALPFSGGVGGAVVVGAWTVSGTALG